MSHSSPQTTPAQPWQEPTSAYPPRFWWLKRGAILFVVMLLALAGLRWWWGKIANDRLAAMIAEAHAKGEPILPEDFNPAPIPDSENAAVTLRLAADSIVRDATYDAFDSAWRGGLLTPAEATQAGQIISINQKSLQLCRAARLQQGVDWNTPFKRPVVMLPFTHLNSQRALANLLELTALSDHATGNDVEATERVLDLLDQSAVVDRGPPFIVSHFTAVGIDFLAISLLDLITPNLEIAGGPGRLPRSTAATREQVRRLIANLLDENEFKKAAVRSWEGERMIAVDRASYVAHNGTAPAAYAIAPYTAGNATPLIGPMIELDEGVRLGRTMSAEAAAVQKPDWPAAVASLPTAPGDDESELEWASQCFSRISGGWHDRALQIHFKLLTDRRGAALALSLRMYRLDHSGHLPATLQELVPQYLSYVPLDPMAAGGHPMRYRPELSPPVVYSVGVDGIDNGGTSLPTSGDHWSTADAVFPLELPTPETQPSADTQDHQ